MSEFKKKYNIKIQEIYYIIITFTILAIRILTMNGESFWGDERISICISDKKAIDILSGVVDPIHPGLFYLVFKWWRHIIPVENHFYIRLLPLLANLGALFYIYKIVRSYLSREYAFLTVTMCCLMVTNYHAGIELRAYTLSNFVFVSFFYYLMIKNKILIPIILFFIASFLHYINIFYFNVVLFIYIVFGKNKKSPWLLFYLLPNVYHSIIIYKRSANPTWLLAPRTLDHYIDIVINYFLNMFLGYSYGSIYWGIFSFVILSIFIYGLIQIHEKKNKLLFYALLSLYVVPLMLIFSVSASVSFLRYTYVVPTVLAIGFTFGICALCRKKWILNSAIFICLVIILSCEPYFYGNYRHPWQQAYEALIDISKNHDSKKTGYHNVMGFNILCGNGNKDDFYVKKYLSNLEVSHHTPEDPPFRLDETKNIHYMLVRIPSGRPNFLQKNIYNLDKYDTVRLKEFRTIQFYKLTLKK